MSLARFAFRVMIFLTIALCLQPIGNKQTGNSSSTSPFDKLNFREIGPATLSGRIDDFAVLESNPSVFYVATSTGGLWKTVSNGTTFEVQFTRETSVSIGANIAEAIASGNIQSLQHSLRIRIGSLKGGIMASTSCPTEVQMRQLIEVKPALDKVIGEANTLIGDLNVLAMEASESAVYPAAMKPIQ